MKTCPTCKFENADNAMICTKCGTMFTVIMNIDPGTMALRDQFSELSKTDLGEKEVLLFVMNDPQPMRLIYEKEIILGRRVGEDAPTVDFSLYGDNQLGVSRKHAAIEWRNNSYLIRDLESSNGTFLNDNPLIPHRTYHLQSGDRIRLGQLPITVYFKDSKPIETTFYIHQTDNRTKMTALELSQTIVPILHLLTEIQKLAEEILKQPAEEIGFLAIRFDAPTNMLRVQAEKPIEIIKTVQEVIQQWKLSNRELLQTAQHTIPLDSLAINFLTQIKGDISSEERKLYASRLVKLIQPLVMSPLEVSTSRIPTPQL